MELLEIVLSSATTIAAAGLAALASVTVAKINKLQKDVRTNHGTANIGEAVDEIRGRLDRMADIQKETAHDVIGRLQYLEDELDRNHPKEE